MTCVIGIETPTGVLLAADSIASSGFGYTQCTRVDRKLIRRGAYVFGFGTSWRMGDILRYHVELATPPKRDLHRHMVMRVIPAVREAFQKHGYAAKDPEAPGGQFLVGVGAALFTIDADFQVGRVSHGYDAIGCGYQIAIGALSVLRHLEPKARARAALEAAEFHAPGVRRPWRFLWTTGGAP